MTRSAAAGGRQAQAGFTIIEILVGIVLLTIIILTVLTPLTGFFGLTRRSDDQVAATQLAQRTLEQIRGEWLSSNRYAQTCLAQSLPQQTPPVEVQIQSLDQDGQVVQNSALRSSCTGAGTMPPMRRVRVVAQVGEARAALSLDIARPVGGGTP